MDENIVVEDQTIYKLHEGKNACFNVYQKSETNALKICLNKESNFEEGEYFWIDENKLDKLKERIWVKWFITSHGRKYYIIVSRGINPKIRLHHHLFDLKKGQYTNFINGNHFDFRQVNITNDMTTSYQVDYTLAYNVFQPSRLTFLKPVNEWIYFKDTRKTILMEGGGSTGLSFIFDATDLPKVQTQSWLIAKDDRCNTYYVRSTHDENGKWFYLHQLLCPGDSNMRVDHINREGLDNRKVNLRRSTSVLNGRNCKMRSDNTSGVTGVCKDKERNAWRVDWIDNQGKSHIKRFCCKRPDILKDEEALQLAIAFRREIEATLGYMNGLPPVHTPIE